VELEATGDALSHLRPCFSSLAGVAVQRSR
jgi:hypothetical protein